MRVERLAIPDVILVVPDRYNDERGFLSEVFSVPRFEEAGLGLPFAQDNHSLSRERGTIRGLHCQVAPRVQGKLVRCVRGAIWDVAVDARQGSPTFGRHVSAELSAENWAQVWVPPGFLHGLCTLVPDTEVLYKVTDLYDRAAERGVRWDDPDLALPWPVPPDEAVLSDKDRELPGWAEMGPLFSMAPILATGGAGQVATALADLGGTRVVRVGRPAFDFDRPESLDETIQANAPALVINAAAWTAVDAAEQAPDAAARANADGPARLALLCARRGIPLIHISTDYVFDGLKGAPYTEADAPNPTGVYGRTKLAGERAVLAAWDQVAVLRTSWIYSSVGKNFVRTMLAAAGRNVPLRVVADQLGCPTAAWDLAPAILIIAEQMLAGWRPAYGGVFHAAGTGDTTWYGLALSVFEAAARHGHTMPEIVPITTADWPTPARRPPDSRLDCTRFAQTFDVRLPPWREGVARTVAALLEPVE